jgi:pimeloyl-ACP methyl ester carboxylesterase
MPSMTTFVLLPGLDGTGKLFTGIAKALAPQGRVVIMRYPPGREQAYADLVAQVLRDWPTGGDTVLLGESFSGPVALQIAARPPANLRAVVLSATFARNPVPYLRPARYVLPFVSPTWLPWFVIEALMLGGHATPRWRKALRRIASRAGGEALSARAIAALDGDARDALARVELPVLYLRAKHDRVIAARCGDEIVSLARDAQLVEIDAPHMLLQIAPREAAEAIDTFLQSVRSRR